MNARTLHLGPFADGVMHLWLPSGNMARGRGLNPPRGALRMSKATSRDCRSLGRSGKNRRPGIGGGVKTYRTLEGGGGNSPRKLFLESLDF